MFGQATYLVLLFAWALPVLVFQWAAGWPEVRARARPIALATAISTLYLSAADHYALGEGIWRLNPERTSGVVILGVPLEEGLFFFITNLMVAQSVALITSTNLNTAVARQRLRSQARSLIDNRSRRAWYVALALSSLGAVLASLISAALASPPALTAPAWFVMLATPVPVAARLIEVLGEWAAALGLLGGFVLYLFLGAVAGWLARSGFPGLVIASALATGGFFWFSDATHPLPAAILALLPLATVLLDRRVPAPAGGVSRLSRRDLLLRGAPVVAAVCLGAIWALERAGRNLAASGAGRRLFDLQPPAARRPSFPVPGQPPEATPVADFYKVSKNLEDPSPSAAAWQLTIAGQVEKPLTLDLEALMAMGRADQYTALRCVSNPVGWPLMSNGYWSGVPLPALLALAGPTAAARWVVCRGLDGHFEDLPLAVALAPDTLVAYALNGYTLDRRHGFPARLVVPGLYGFKNVKWLGQIEVVAEDTPGYWPLKGYTRTGEMSTAARIDLARPLDGGVLVAGVALAGERGISRVEVRPLPATGPGAWVEAEVHVPPLGRAAWVQWQVRLPGLSQAGTRVQARAFDGRGEPQSEEERGPFPDGATGLHTVEVKA